MKYISFCLILGSCILTWMIFKLFPAIPDASNVITVFAGVLGSILVIIQLHEHFNKVSG